MPWKELKPMDLKVMFIAAYLSEERRFCAVGNPAWMPG